MCFNNRVTSQKRKMKHRNFALTAKILDKFQMKTLPYELFKLVQVDILCS